MLFTEGPEESEEPSVLERMLDGYASAELMENVTIRKNQKNQLSLTLVPSCGDSGITISENLELNVYTEEGDPDRLIRKYIRLDGIGSPAGYTLNSLICTVRATGGIYVGSMALFDQDGVMIGQREQINATISADRGVTRPWNGDETLYLYVEYRGSELSLAFSGEMTSGTTPKDILLNVSAGSAHAGRKLIAGIFPYTGEDDPEGEPVSVAVINLDASGSGSVSFADANTGAVHSFGAGTWTIKGFIDANGNYPDILTVANLVSTEGIEPHYGDYTCQVTVTTDGTVSVSRGLAAGDFVMTDTYVYYVSQGGAGSRNGQRIANAMSVITFRQLLETSSARLIRAYSLGGISFDTNSMWIIANGDQVMLSSINPAAPQTLMVGFDGSLEVRAGSTLYLSNITIDGGTSEYNNPLVSLDGALILADGARLQNRTDVEGAGGVQVNGGGVLTMEDGSFISNCIAPYGGGVALFGESMAFPAVFTMNGGTITGCSATYGGAIAAQPASNVTLDGGTIELCDATDFGGAVYMYGDISMPATLALSGTGITRCSVAQGGAVYAEINVTINMTDGILDQCTASDSGGGFYLSADTGSPVTLSLAGGTISNCSATDNGGGVYAESMYATVTMSGGSVDTCQATNGGGFWISSAVLNLQSTARIRSSNHALTEVGWALYYVESSPISPDPGTEPAAIQSFIEGWDEDAVFRLLI